MKFLKVIAGRYRDGETTYDGAIREAEEIARSFSANNGIDITPLLIMGVNEEQELALRIIMPEYLTLREYIPELMPVGTLDRFSRKPRDNETTTPEQRKRARENLRRIHAL